jgi:hypothetical protein
MEWILFELTNMNRSAIDRFIPNLAILILTGMAIYNGSIGNYPKATFCLLWIIAIQLATLDMRIK